MRLTFLTGDINWQTYGGTWVTKKLNNGDFDYWIVVEFINLEESLSESELKEVGFKYQVEVHAVSPSEAGVKGLQNALECVGMENFEGEITDLMKVEALYQYGISAFLDSFTGNNAREVMKDARHSLDAIASMLGFFMDGAKNRLGHTGWDLIKGDLSWETAEKNREEDIGNVPNWHVQPKEG
ncbi:MAG: hypothetical protein WC476_01670 [Phycisphaerae bacterium]|jgi:hypothetical protein